jgi:hypothetical protein
MTADDRFCGDAPAPRSCSSTIFFAHSIMANSDAAEGTSRTATRSLEQICPSVFLAVGGSGLLSNEA